jgi:Rha family phage regulatory protein
MNNELVYNDSYGEAVTDTLTIAKVFDKRHRDVLKSVRTMLESVNATFNDVKTPISQRDNRGAQSFAALYVSESEYKNLNGQMCPMYILNRDAFTMLAMGFVGNKAMQFKMQYISAFNKMEKYIEEQKAQVPASMSAAEMLLKSAQLMVEHEKRMAAIEDRTRTIEKTTIELQEKEHELHNKMEEMEREREDNAEQLNGMELSKVNAPEATMRDRIRLAVDRYCKANNVGYKDFYDRLWHDIYHIDHIRVDKGACGSKLEACEKRGIIDIVWNRVSAIIRGR